MTTPEHTLVGIHCALLFGLNQKHGWQVVAIAGIASNFPDWDGLPMLINMEQFESGHRVWGHNIFSIALSAILFSLVQTRFNLLGQLTEGLVRTGILSSLELDSESKAAAKVAQAEPSTTMTIMIGTAVQLIHLPCDMVVSGGSGLSDWPVRPWWPVSNAAYVFPMISWGDVGPTLIMMAGIIFAAKWQRNLSTVSLITFVILIGYLILRSTFV